MNNKQALNDFVDALINGDNDKAEQAFAPFVTEKAKEVVKKMLKEFNDGPIQIRQDDNVFVNGKHIGKISSDIDDFDSGINFVSADGKFSKEFVDIDSLTAFLRQKFNVAEGVK